MANVNRIQGCPELRRALDELRDMTRPEWKSVLRAGVSKPGRRVLSVARGNIARFSPGRTLMHRTYRGRQVGAGFASRSLRMVVKLNRESTSVTAIMGVRAEAFYALQFFEKGTAKIPAQPFLVPALRASQSSAPADVGAAIKGRIVRIAAKYAKARLT